jgi:SAM-dependent methyltransferase
MIGRKQLPAEFEAWNEQWGAPFGYAGNRLYSEGKGPFSGIREAWRDPASPNVGPFGFQTNSHTRIYEYPWAYHAAKLTSGMRVLDVGGGISGFQFVVAKAGCQVVNVDPTARADYNTWSDPGFIELTLEQHGALNQIFTTDVTLVADKIQDAPLEDGSFDRIFCLSVLEHVEPDEAQEMTAAFGRLLKPGGRAVLTVDLFLDLPPFGVLDRNTWGVNHDVAQLVKSSGLELVEGDPRELLGFPEFDRERVVGLIPELFVSPAYPVMTQTLVLEKTP